MKATSHLPSETLNSISPDGPPYSEIHKDTNKDDSDNLLSSVNGSPTENGLGRAGAKHHNTLFNGNQFDVIDSNHASVNERGTNQISLQNFVHLTERPEPLGKARQEIDDTKQQSGKANHESDAESEIGSEQMNNMQDKNNALIYEGHLPVASDEDEYVHRHSDSSLTEFRVLPSAQKESGSQGKHGVVSAIEQILRNRGELERQHSSSSSSTSISVGSYHELSLSNVSALLAPPFQARTKQTVHEVTNRSYDPKEQQIRGGDESIIAKKHPPDPLQMAADALKASSLLTAKTEKSLKLATEMLKAVDEQRTPINMSSLSSGELDMDTDSGVSSKETLVSKETAIRTETNKFGENFTRDMASAGDHSKSSSLSVDIRFRDERMKQLTKLLSESSDNSSGQGSKPNMYSTPVSDTSPAFLQKTSTGNNVSHSENINSTFDSTSSELMRLKASHASSLLNSFPKSEGPLEPDFSPINGVEEFKKADGLQASHKTNSMGIGMQDSSTDTEIERFHRSLGAGTVTPLPDLKTDQRMHLNGHKKKVTSTPSSNESTSSHASSKMEPKYNDLKDKSHPKPSSSTSNFTLSSQDATVDSKVGEFVANGSTSSVSSVSPNLNSFADRNSNSGSEKQYAVNENVPDHGVGNRKLDVIQEWDNENPGKSRDLTRFHSRGVYDIRDSSGPGSTNRKRRVQGKKPLPERSARKDPLTIYVSDGSRVTSSMSSTRKEGLVGGLKAQGYKNKGLHDAGVNTDAIDNMIRDKESDRISSLIVHDRVTTDSHSSSPQSFDSDDTDVLISARIEAMPKLGPYYRADLARNFPHKKSGYNSRTEQNEHKNMSSYDISSDRYRYPRSAFHRPDLKSDFAVRSKSNEPKLKPMPSNINQLWEKFQSSFSPAGYQRSRIEEKITTLSNLITPKNNIPSIKSETASRSKHKMIADKLQSETKSNILLSQSSRDVSTPVEKPKKSNATVGMNSNASVETCVHCRKRDMATNCPTPVSMSSKHGNPQSNEPPLLLQAWTQTTPSPYNYGREIVLSDNKTQDKRETRFRHKNASSTADDAGRFRQKTIATFANKENGSHVNKKTSSSPENPRSWTVYVDENQRKNKQSELRMSKKPPIPDQLSNVDKLIHEKEQEKKKRKLQPVYTAWFQSTRSDTSEGTIVPLSEVPILSHTFKEKREPKVHIEERIVNTQE